MYNAKSPGHVHECTIIMTVSNQFLGNTGVSIRSIKPTEMGTCPIKVQKRTLGMFSIMYGLHFVTRTVNEKKIPVLTAAVIPTICPNKVLGLIFSSKLSNGFFIFTNSLSLYLFSVIDLFISSVLLDLSGCNTVSFHVLFFPVAKFSLAEFWLRYHNNANYTNKSKQ